MYTNVGTGTDFGSQHIGTLVNQFSVSVKKQIYKVYRFYTSCTFVSLILNFPYGGLTNGTSSRIVS